MERTEMIPKAALLVFGDASESNLRLVEAMPELLEVQDFLQANEEE